MALKVGELFASFNLDTSGLSSSISDAEKKMNSIGSSLMVSGTAMSAAVTAPIVKAAKAAYQAGTDFGAQMSKVFALGGIQDNAEDMEKLRAAALEMGSTTAFTATEAGEALQYMALAGWKTDAMLEGLAPIMNLAAASGESLGSVSDIVTDAITAFGLSAQDATMFADVLAAASTNANTTVGMLGESFKYVAPLAGSMNYSVQDVATALGLMANAGIKGSMAGTSLRQIISNMISPTDSQAEAMQALGVSLYDANGAIRPFYDVMGDLRKAAKDVDLKEIARQVEELDGQLEAGTITEDEYNAAVQQLTEGQGSFLQAVSDLAGARGLSGMLAIMNATDEDFQKLYGSIVNADGAADTMAKTMLDNVQGSVTLLKSAGEGLEITLFGLVEGPLKGLIDKATQIVDSFRNMDKATQTGALRLGAVAAAAGPVMIIAGKAIKILPKIVPALSALASPLGLLAIGAAAVGAAFLNKDNEIGDVLTRMANTAGEKLSALVATVDKSGPELSKRMSMLLGSMTQSVQHVFPELVRLMIRGVSTFADTITANLDGIGAFVDSIWESITSTFKRESTRMIPSIVKLVVKTFTTAIRRVPQRLKSIADIAQGLVDGFRAVDWNSLGTEIWDAIKAAFKGTGDVLKSLILGSSYSPGSTWGEVGRKIWDSIKNGLKVTGDWLKELILGDAYSPDSTWSDVGKKLWEKIKKGVSATGDWLHEVINKGREYIAGDGWKTIGANVWKKIKEGITAVGDWLAGKILPDQYTPGEGWKTIGQNIWKKIKDGITAVGDWLASKIVPGQYTAGEGWKSVGTAVWDKIKDGIVAAKDLAGKASDWLCGILGIESFTADGAWETAGSTIWEAIKNGFKVTTGWLKDLLLPKGDNGEVDVGSWGDTAEKIVKAITGSLTHSSIMEFLSGFIGGIVNTLSGKDSAGKEDKAVADGVNTLFQGIIRGIMTGLEHAVSAAGDLAVSILGLFEIIFSEENINKAFSFANDTVDTVADGAKGGLLSTISDVVGRILTAIGNLLSKERIGALIQGVKTLITNLLDRVTELISSGQLTDFINNIISAIGTVLSNVTGNAGNLLTGAVEIGRGIMHMIAEGIKQAPSIINALLTALGEGLGSLADSLNEQDAFANGVSAMQGWEEVIGATGDAMQDMAGQNGIQVFFENLGRALMAGVKYAAEYLQGIGKELLRYIFSGEILADAWNLASGLVSMIVRGASSALTGAWTELGNSAFKGIYEELDKTYDDMPKWMQDAAYELFGYQPGKEAPISDDIPIVKQNNGDEVATVRNLAKTLGQVWSDTDQWGDGNKLGAIDADLIEAIKEASKKDGGTSNIAVGMDPESANATMLANVQRALKGTIKYEGKSIPMWQYWGFSSEESAMAAVKTWYSELNNHTPIVVAAAEAAAEAVNEAAEETGEAISEASDAAAEENGEAVKDAAHEAAEKMLEEFGYSAQEGVDEAQAGSVTGDVSIAPQAAVEGFTVTLGDGKTEVADTAAQVSDAAVQAYLVRMNYENAQAIAENWLAGISETIAADENGATSAQDFANTILNTVQTRLNSKAWGIGNNFSLGIANGIRSGLIYVIGAARDVASAAIGTLENELEIGSPSRVTAEIGGFFDEGFINEILAGSGSAGQAARSLGREAVGRLQSTVAEMSGSAANELSLPVRREPTMQEVRAIESEANAERIGAAIARALDGALVTMDGEQVGHLVVPTVSLDLAMGAASRRYGTE